MTDVYDYNSIEGNNRTIFITNFYEQLNNRNESVNVYNMCIRFYTLFQKVMVMLALM